MKNSIGVNGSVAPAVVGDSASGLRAIGFIESIESLGASDHLGPHGPHGPHGIVFQMFRNQYV